MDRDIRMVIDALNASGEPDLERFIHETGMAVGDQLHVIMKTAATAMPSVASAIGVAVHATAQMLVETIEFGERSTAGDGDDLTLRAAALQMFVDLVNQALPGSLARPS